MSPSLTHSHLSLTLSASQVLSVDDDPVNQMVIQNLLEPEGYDVCQAMDGQECLEKLAESEELPDVILLDVMMPGMSGYEVSERRKGGGTCGCGV